MTVFRAYSGYACYGAANPSDNRDSCTNGHKRLGIPIFYLGQARDAEYQWINNPVSDRIDTQAKIETAINMNPNSTLVLGDEVNASMSAEDYADLYLYWYSWIKKRSPVTRLSTCGFGSNPDLFQPPGKGYAERFIDKVNQTVDPDEFRFNSLFPGQFVDFQSYIDTFEQYLDDCDAFARGHGYSNNYCVGSFYPGTSTTPAQLRRVMLLIQDRGTVKEAVYWGFDAFTTDVTGPLATWITGQDGVSVPVLNDYGIIYAQTIRDIEESPKQMSVERAGRAARPDDWRHPESEG
jgi:hypothetical protein